MFVIDDHTFLKIYNLEWVSFVLCGDSFNLSVKLKHFLPHHCDIFIFLKMFFSSVTKA